MQVERFPAYAQVPPEGAGSQGGKKSRGFSDKLWLGLLNPSDSGLKGLNKFSCRRHIVRHQNVVFKIPR
jgi:hypothetical protein